MDRCYSGDPEPDQPVRAALPMESTREHRLPDLEQHLERQMRAQEQQLAVVRFAVVLLAGALILAFRAQLAAFWLVVGVLTVVALYDAALLLLLKRFPAREVGIVATALDMVAVTVAIYAEPQALDAYLFYGPVILAAALRFGLGASVWSSLVVSFMYASVVLLGPGSPGMVLELLPVRVAYLVGIGLAAGLFARVVIGRAAQNAQLQYRLDAEEREAARAREREILSAMVRDFGDSLELGATVGAVVRGAAPLLGAATALSLVDDQRLRLAAVAGPDADLVERWRTHLAERTVRVGEGIAGGAAATATSILAGADATPPVFPGDPDGVSGLGLRSILAVPILSRGTVRGVLVSGSVGLQALGEDERRLAEAIADRAGPALENAALWADLQDQVAREQRAQSIKDDFLSIVSHELRTPLTSIQGYSQLLESRLRAVTDGNLKELSHLRVIRSQVGRMRRLVDDLLDVSRIDRRGVVSIEPARIELADDLREVAGRTQRAHRDRMVTLEVPQTLPVEADRDRIAQVLTNLVDNAVKYSPRAGPVTIRAQRQGSDVVVSVADAGIGIPAEQLDLVFDRFYQADADASGRRFGGLGLGLYISRAIIEAHGGAISAAPNLEAGRGSIFSFRIPVRAAVRASSVEAPAPGEPPPFVLRRREPGT